MRVIGIIVGCVALAALSVCLGWRLGMAKAASIIATDAASKSPKLLLLLHRIGIDARYRDDFAVPSADTKKEA